MKSIESIIKNDRVRIIIQEDGYIAGKLKTDKGSTLSFIFGSDEDGYEHLSVSKINRLPDWEELLSARYVFWEDEEEVIQILPKKSEYVNIHKNCLHLWRHKTHAYQFVDEKSAL